MSVETTETSAIRRSVTVECSAEHAWATFTERIHEWWPLETHSIQADEDRGRAETVAFEGGVGGRLYERTTDGEELAWAEITAWDPPTRLVLEWNPSRDTTRPRTEVEVRFLGQGRSTRVELEHRGWERLGERGPQVRRGYESHGGWALVLGGFAEAASR